MKSVKFTHRSGKAAFALVALLALQNLFVGVNAYTKTAAQSNFAAEGQALESFSDDLSAYIEQENNLRKKTTLTKADLAALRASGEGLKRRFSTVQQNLRSLISKLKSARRWDNLDQEVIAGIKDAEFRRLLEGEGGTRRIWEDLASNLNQLGSEIDRDALSLGNKVKAQLSPTELQQRAVRVSYQPPPVFARSLKCRVQIAIATVAHVTGRITDKRIKKVIDACKDSTAAGSSPTT
ncbi:MAG: hypothetical protein AB1631_07910 [Acidobacteriota bacterium]